MQSAVRWAFFRSLRSRALTQNMQSAVRWAFFRSLLSRALTLAAAPDEFFRSL
jgi:hypothetical protein